MHKIKIVESCRDENGLGRFVCVWCGYRRENDPSALARHSIQG